MPSVAISEERLAITTRAPTPTPIAMPVTRAPSDPRKGLKSRVHRRARISRRRNPSSRETQVELPDRDDEHQRHHETQRHRQRDQHRIVDRPAQEHPGAGDHEYADHHYEHGERARRPIGGEAPQGAVGRWRARRRARDRLERGAHAAAPASTWLGSNEAIPSGWASFSMNAIKRSALPTSALVVCNATRPRSITTKRSAMSKT